MTTNQQWRLARTPPLGHPSDGDFELHEAPMPTPASRPSIPVSPVATPAAPSRASSPISTVTKWAIDATRAVIL